MEKTIYYRTGRINYKKELLNLEIFFLTKINIT